MRTGFECGSGVRTVGSEKPGAFTTRRVRSCTQGLEHEGGDTGEGALVTKDNCLDLLEKK